MTGGGEETTQTPRDLQQLPAGDECKGQWE